MLILITYSSVQPDSPLTEAVRAAICKIEMIYVSQLYLTDSKYEILQ